MRAIRSLLWIGPGRGLADCGVSEAPTLDITWVPSVDEAFDLPAMPFDGTVLEGSMSSSLVEDLRRLLARRRPTPVLVCLDALSGLTGLGGLEDEHRPSSQGANATHDTGHADVVRKLLTQGAQEVIVTGGAQGMTPLLDELLACVDRLGLCQSRSPGSEPSPDLAEGNEQNSLSADVVGQSRAMRDVYALVLRARRSNATVLLTGETGSGKEVMAQQIHESGPRSHASFVAVNCAAFPDTLLDSELFGHVRGAFTGAQRDKSGLFEIAHRGTLFLDEVAETSPALQAKLLRVLQQREILPVGGLQPRSIDVRIISATNKDLAAAVQQGHFREDLYYRLAVFPIEVPALRKRPEDILPLAGHFLEIHGRTEHKPGCRLSSASQRLLQSHHWPGNVRELENEMQRALALCEAGGLITPKLLSAKVLGIIAAIDEAPRGNTLRESLDHIEAWLIRRALETHSGRKAVTAQRLGVTREGLYKKMKRLGIE